MTAPIVGIYLPVYLSAFKATQDEANKRVVHCTIFPTPLEVDLAAIDKPMSPANQTIVDAYLQKLQADCPVATAAAASEDADAFNSFTSTPLGKQVADAMLNMASVTTGEALDPAQPALAGYVLLDLRLSALDPAEQLATFSVRVVPNSMFPYDTGLWDDFSQSLRLPPGLSVQVDIFSDQSGSGVVRLKTGDRQAALTSSMAVDPIRDIFYYPFDTYSLAVEVALLASNADGSLVLPLSFLVSTRNRMPGWVLKAQPITKAFDQYMGDPGRAYLSYTLVLERSPYLRFSVIIIFVSLWIMVACACSFAWDLTYFRPRESTIADASILFAICFAVYGVRAALPSVPSQSVGIDYFGFIFHMIMLMLAGASVLAHQHRWHVAAAPTVYDRVLASLRPASSRAGEMAPKAAADAGGPGPSAPTAAAAGAATAAKS